MEISRHDTVVSASPAPSFDRLASFPSTSKTEFRGKHWTFSIRMTEVAAVASAVEPAAILATLPAIEGSKLQPPPQQPQQQPPPSSVSQSHTTLPRLERTTVCLPIVHGSVAFYLGKKADEFQSHQWTLYLRGPHNEDLSHCIQKVVFQLHASFAQPVREFTVPPFEVTEKGWGEFEAQIRIHWKDPTENMTMVRPGRCARSIYPTHAPFPRHSQVRSGLEIFFVSPRSKLLPFPSFISSLTRLLTASGCTHPEHPPLRLPRTRKNQWSRKPTTKLSLPIPTRISSGSCWLSVRHRRSRPSTPNTRTLPSFPTRMTFTFCWRHKSF